MRSSLRGRCDQSKIEGRVKSVCVEGSIGKLALCREGTILTCMYKNLPGRRARELEGNSYLGHAKAKRKDTILKAGSIVYHMCLGCFTFTFEDMIARPCFSLSSPRPPRPNV